jgi:predicted nucleic acid-binding protein
VRVYIESNFLLEIALQQEQAAAAARLLDWAEAGRIGMALPVVSLCEPFSLLAYRARHREMLKQSLDRETRELQRESPRRELAGAMDAWAQQLIQVGRQHADALNSVVERLLRTADLLPLTPETFDRAMRLQVEHDLSIRDAMTLAMILAACEAAPSEAGCFVSRDAKDLAGASGQLLPPTVRFVASFEGALGYVEQHVAGRH